MKTKIEKLPKSTLKITVTVPNEKVKKTYEKLMTDIVKNAEVRGFRKGQAPRNIVEEQTNVSKLYGDIIDELLKTYYPQALKEKLISPISNPQVEITEFDLEKDFEFTATVAIRPDVKIKEYKKALKKAKTDKEEKVRKENEEKLKNGEKLEDSHAHLHINEIIKVLLENTEVEIPDLLIQEETDRMLAQLMDQTKTLGMSLEQYLKAQNKTGDQLREDYNKISERNIKAEFVMAQLIKDENIEVTDQEIEDTAKAAGDPAILEALNKDPMQKWYIKSILQKNKLISKLMEETDHER